MTENWHGISRVVGHTPADCPGPEMCDYAKTAIECGDCGDELVATRDGGEQTVYSHIDGTPACTSRRQANTRRARQGRPPVGGPAPTGDTWTCVGSTMLARRIAIVTGVGQAAAEQLAAEVVDNDLLEFVTETRVAGRARLGVQPATWRAWRDTDPGHRTDWFKLERLEG